MILRASEWRMHVFTVQKGARTTYCVTSEQTTLRPPTWTSTGLFSIRLASASIWRGKVAEKSTVCLSGLHELIRCITCILTVRKRSSVYSSKHAANARSDATSSLRHLQNIMPNLFAYLLFTNVDLCKRVWWRVCNCFPDEDFLSGSNCGFKARLDWGRARSCQAQPFVLLCPGVAEPSTAQTYPTQ